MNARIFSAVSVLMLALSPATVTRADSTITMQDAAGTPQAVIEVKGNMARMSTPGQSDYIVYDASRDLVINVDSEGQEYMEIDRATLAEFSAAMSQMQQEMAPQIAQMREQLKSLPPEQRAMFEQQMGGMANFGASESKPAEPIELVKRGSDKVGGFKCQVYDAMQGKDKISEVCLATAADAGVSKSDFATLSAMMDFMREMASSAQQLSADLGGSQHIMLGGAKGVPVSVKEFKGGHEYAVADVSDKTLDDARFNDYKAYRKEQMPTMQ
ncbi:MAG: hypothetical protein WBM52_20535 [Thiogranum sp.]